MDKRGVYLQLYARATAPSRDYYGLTITQHEIIINVWNISHGPHVFPKRQKCDLDEFNENKPMICEIGRVFGNHVVDFVLKLSAGDSKLECLPTKIFLKIVRHLAINDIFHLGQTSKIFFELCNRDDVWRLIYSKCFERKLAREEVRDGELKGWRNLLKYKLLLQERRRIPSIVSSKSSTIAVKPPPIPSFIKQSRSVDKNAFINNATINSDKTTTASQKSSLQSVKVMLNNSKVRNDTKQMTLNNKLNLIVDRGSGLNGTKHLSNLCLIDNLAKDKEKLQKVKSFDIKSGATTTTTPPNKKLLKNNNVIRANM